MLFGFVLLFGYAFVIWLVFFKYKWMKFSIAWGVVSCSVGAHLIVIFMIGLRFVTPCSTDAKVIQHTIQLIPRLTEPTLVTAVLAEPNQPVKKGQPLFQFDRRPYEDRVRQLEAEFAHAVQNVKVLKTDEAISAQKVAKGERELEYSKYQQQLSAGLAQKGAGPQEDVQKWLTQVGVNEAAIQEARGETERARLKYQSSIGGVNTTVASIEAQLDLARYYLDNTTLVAPEDGSLINLQVRPGMVAGEFRIGAIASFVCDADRYVLASFFQENLKYVKAGQAAEVALDLYPGQIFPGKVAAIWWGSGQGQLLPSGTIPEFKYLPTEIPQGQFAVAITLDDKDQSKFPIGTQGRAAIYTNPRSGFAVLRRVGIRTYTWFNWIYPFSG